MFPDRIQPSIKDYQIIKAISKGAFGSVFLAKKKITGEYFAIKVLKKSDMVVKNQVMNVKAERTILTQLDSPFVVKLYYSFQSANHIYLVMEYLPGGDCAALLKSVQQLDEPWTRQYISEIVLGLEFLHERDIIHRDLKPDNLLIDAKGHIKLTDFGLSKVGFLGRRAHQTEQKQSSLVNSPSFSQLLPASPSFGSLSESPKMSVTQQASKKLDEREHKNNFVGTPDYLAPECIVGYGQGPSVDWWAVGVIMYEFLLGIPPFNAMTTTQVFENIVMRRIDWMEDEVELTMEAKDLMDKLMCTKVEDRLGTQSTDQVKAHPWFNNLDWKSVWEQPAPFTPTIKGLEDTDYFDARGAKDIEISDDPLVQQGTDFG
ncbi:kinase-like domain-containing protein, partial [Gorgonomyces haynaldii]